MSKPHFHNFIRFSAVGILLVGGIVLLGYIFHFSLLEGIIGEQIAMNPLTAVTMIFCSIWLLLLLYWKPQRPLMVRTLLLLIPAIIMVLSFRRVIEISFNLPFAIDQILFEEETRYSRMASATAINFLLISIGMIAGYTRFRGSTKVFHFATIFSLAISLISVFGYLVGSNNAETTKPFDPMALHTTICFLIFGLSLLFIFPQYSFIRNLMSEDLGGNSARKLIAFAVIVPIGLAYLRFAGERLDLYDPGFGLALQVVSTTIIFLFLIWREARSLNKIDRRRKEIELMIEERSRQLSEANKHLERSNYELEQFAYVASHDLQEPLRKIQTFGDILQQNPSSLDETGRDHLDRIVRAASRMSTLVQDLLTFSRLIEVDDQFEEIDLNAIIKSVIGDYELMIAEKKAVIVSDPLPVIEGISFQINQLFYNLINNALKFVREDRTPKIKIECSVAEDGVLAAQNLSNEQIYYHIRFIDNGIGFDPKNSSRIFQMFQRLPHTTSFGGSGIGLALCKKIAVNHQGEIFSESVPGIGSTFHVLLPQKQKLPVNPSPQHPQ